MNTIKKYLDALITAIKNQGHTTANREERRKAKRMAGRMTPQGRFHGGIPLESKVGKEYKITRAASGKGDL